MKNAMFVLSGAVLFLVSCKKDKDPDPPGETVHKVKAITDVATGIAYTYDYDAQGRLLKEGRSNNQRRNEYVYTTGNVLMSEYDAAGVFQYSSNFILNAEGLCIRRTYIGSPGDERILSYNSDKQISKDVAWEGGVEKYTNTYFYTNKLLDSVQVRTASGALLSVLKYEYFPGIDNTTSLQYIGLGFLGKQSPKATKKLTNISYDITTGAITSNQEINFSYETDSQGRIVKVTNSGSTTGSATYTYY